MVLEFVLENKLSQSLRFCGRRKKYSVPDETSDACLDLFAY